MRTARGPWAPTCLFSATVRLPGMVVRSQADHGMAVEAAREAVARAAVSIEHHLWALWSREGRERFLYSFDERGLELAGRARPRIQATADGVAERDVALGECPFERAQRQRTANGRKLERPSSPRFLAFDDGNAGQDGLQTDRASGRA